MLTIHTPQSCYIISEGLLKISCPWLIFITIFHLLKRDYLRKQSGNKRKWIYTKIASQYYFEGCCLNITLKRIVLILVWSGAVKILVKRTYQNFSLKGIFINPNKAHCTILASNLTHELMVLIILNCILSNCRFAFSLQKLIQSYLVALFEIRNNWLN